MSNAAEQSPPADGSPAEEVKVFKAPSGASSSYTPNDLPDSFYQPTAAELRVAAASAKKLRESVHDGPLMTRAMREREESKKPKKTWPTARIRVRFADRSQIERTFQSTETISAIYDFVRQSLDPSYTEKAFTLYQSPPRRDFRENDPKVSSLSLAQLQFAPSSVLSIRFDDERMNLSGAPSPLASSLQAKAEELPPPKTFDTPLEAESPGAGTEGKEGSREPRKVLPKWLKGLHKK